MGMTTRRTKIAALVAGCAVVAGGSYAAADALSGSSRAPAAAVSSANGQRAGASDAAALSSALSDSGTSAGIAASAPAKRRAARRALLRLRRLGGEYGQFTFQTRKGTRTLAFERGTIVSLDGTDVTVRAADGDTMTWVLTGKSVVRDDGSKTTPSALAPGEKVLVAGPVSGTTRDARLIVIRHPGQRRVKSGQKATSSATSAS